jgi:hypothetical protein
MVLFHEAISIAITHEGNNYSNPFVLGRQGF